MRTLIRGIGELISGDVAEPRLDADSLLLEDGRIAAVGTGLTDDAERIIDAAGSTVMPGLIDSHSHPVIGDFTPRQRTLDVYQSGLHGGVTSAVSAGEPHLPGRPKDVDGLKALAILAQKSFANARPGGVKVHAGAPLIEEALTQADIGDMAAAGVKRLGEIGLGSARTPETAGPIVAWARSAGMTSTIHTGGPSIPGSSEIGAEVVLGIAPDIVGHINGGPTAMTRADIERLVDSRMALEIVHNGNGRAALDTLLLATEADALERVLIGTDSPAGSGVMPLGMLRVIAHLASLGGAAPDVAIAFATGNVARAHHVEGGRIEAGAPADLVICDAPVGSAGDTAMRALAAGDLPGISMVLVDGDPLVGRSRNTPPAARMATIEGGSGPAARR